MAEEDQTFLTRVLPAFNAAPNPADQRTQPAAPLNAVSFLFMLFVKRERYEFELVSLTFHVITRAILCMEPVILTALEPLA